MVKCFILNVPTMNYIIYHHYIHIIYSESKLQMYSDLLKQATDSIF